MSGAVQPYWALLSCKAIGDDDESHRKQPRAAQALHGPENDELAHAVAQQRQGPELAGQSAQPRAHQEHADGHHFNGAARVHVGELAIDGHQRRADHQIGRGHPGEAVEPVQIGHDARQGGGNDGLVERAQEHGQQDAAKREHFLPMGEGFGQNERR